MTNVLLIVTGSISAYKGPDIANALRKSGYAVRVVVTEAATQFINPRSFYGQNIDTYQDADEWNYRGGVLHIELARWADMILVAPATANTIAKLANGVTDNLATSVLRAFSGIVYIAPAMNTQMYLNSKEIREQLQKEYRFNFIEPRDTLLACGERGIGGLADKADILNVISKPLFPINSEVVGSTDDLMSFQKIDISTQVEIPTSLHCGGFAFKRKFHIHEGIDLYAPDGKPVYACEAGVITRWDNFTGTWAGSPWWNATESLTVKSQYDKKYIVYGEIIVLPELKAVGTSVKKGQLIGHIRTVLIKDKGRPMSMLHLERYAADVEPRSVWNVDAPKPKGLEDPYEYLVNCYA